MNSTRQKVKYKRHGLYYTPEYKSWSDMLSRCYYPKNKRYDNYGGRGIVVCARWQKSIENFINDMGYRPSPKHTLDRINVDGNYEIANCRWATPTQQALNRTLGIRNTSGYRGVYFIKRLNKWQADFKYLGKHYYAGVYEDKVSAALAYNKVAYSIAGKDAKLNEIPNV